VRTLFGFAVGYLVGSKAGGEGYEELVRSAKAIRDSEEVQHFVEVLREHASHVLREVSDWVGGIEGTPTLDDLLAEARARLQR
jgi:transcriptional regulator CtsR